MSNLLFISQPLGVGFSYADQTEATLDLAQLRESRMASMANADITDGRFKKTLGGSAIETSAMAAKATWHVVQTFLANLPTISPKITSRDFHLWTERLVSLWKYVIRVCANLLVVMAGTMVQVCLFSSRKVADSTNPLKLFSSISKAKMAW